MLCACKIHNIDGTSGMREVSSDFDERQVLQMQTIQAQVSKRLLTKASRLFTGALEGRIIEILQNSRRAGATQVSIINQDGLVTVHDNGSGIDDFSKLLSLGDSDWDDSLEKAEDPAGVGVFCLAPREVTIRSGSKKVCITEKAWTGQPVMVRQNDDSLKEGTVLMFQDEPWTFATVQKHAVFTGLTVTVDGAECAKEHFSSDKAVDYTALGCKIEVRPREALNEWHTRFRNGYYSRDILVNFHGQVVSFTDLPVSDRELAFLVDMTGNPTGIRLMLPARTRLVENEAFVELKAALEVEAYRFIQRRGSHKLPFKGYRRAKELGIQLAEAEPVFAVGLLSGDMPEPIEVSMPSDFPLERCYRFNENCHDSEAHEANAHLLAALGKFKEPLVPVTIASCYDGYRWANLPTIDKVEVAVGKELGSESICNETLIAVDSLHISVHTCDKKVFTSDVPMAVLEKPKKERTWRSMNIYVTLEARSQLSSTDIWYHLGGWNDEGDTWDTQLYDLEQQLEQFWATIIGPAEYLRSKIRSCLYGVVEDWKQIVFDDNEAITITYQDGTVKSYGSPSGNSAAT